jgi:hypothetical protein
MSSAVDILYSISFMSFCAFIISAGFSLRGRAALKQKLKEEGFERYDEYFLNGFSFEGALKMTAFFLVGRWEEVPTPKLTAALKKHRYIEILTVFLFFTAQSCLILALFFSGQLDINGG